MYFRKECVVRGVRIFSCQELPSTNFQFVDISSFFFFFFDVTFFFISQSIILFFHAAIPLNIELNMNVYKTYELKLRSVSDGI